MDCGSREGDSRKRPSKGLRAFCECKKRKMQANTASSAEKGGLGDPNGLGNADDENPCPLHLGERLSKLEQLFEKFVCRKWCPEVVPEAPRSPMSMDSKPTAEEQPDMSFGILPDIRRKFHSSTSLSEDIASWRDNRSELPGHTKTWNSNPSVRTLVDSNDNGPVPSSETVRRSLVALLPSQHDADVIFESTNGWMILNSFYTPSRELFVGKDPQTYALDMAAVAKEPSIIVARTLVHIAIGIDTLPPGFDSGRLSDIWNLEAAVQNYIHIVTSLMTSSDELLCTLPGLETLMLLAIYHINSSNLRQAWLIVRRAMNLAQLMGFHRIIAQPTTSPPIAAVANAKIVWCGLVDAEGYLGLHLRLPFVAEAYPYPEDLEPHQMHRAELGKLARKVAEIDSAVTPQTYVRALAIDEQLESLMKRMGKEYWEVPNVPSTARSPECASVLERLVGQIWHFELKIITHLPFLLRAPNESRYEYSKITALQASRNLILRWFALRNAWITQACCRFAELGVFIAMMTIGLDIIMEMGTKEPSEVQRTRGSDFAMVCRVISEMEKLGKASPREKIAARSASVMKNIMSSLDPSRRSDKPARITIPYFGTIDISFHKPPVRPPFDLDSDAGKKLNSRTTGTSMPVFSFACNELWPTTSDGSGLLDCDIILFDGLEDKDVEGNWMF